MTDITRRDTATILEQVVIGGDLSKLAPAERVTYYDQVCKSLGLNPLTRPFQYLTLNGRMVLYASRDCTDQLRKLHNVRVRITSRERLEDVYVVTAFAELPDGRTDESIGAVAVAALKGDALANALMKAETKAKRRATLSIVGLGWLDETEIETIPDAQRVTVSEVPQVEAPKAAPVINAIICSDCKEAIQPIIVNGAMRAPDYIATLTKRRFQRVLCAECGRKAEAARAAKQAETEEPAPDATLAEIAG